MKQAEVIAWANKRGILANSTPQAQFTKMVEEIGEIAECISKGRKDDIKLEIGDLVVTAILLAKLYDYSLSECLDAAYDKISNREGKVVDGIFIKDADGNV